MTEKDDVEFKLIEPNHDKITADQKILCQQIAEPSRTTANVSVDFVAFEKDCLEHAIQKKAFERTTALRDVHVHDGFENSRQIRHRR